MLNTKSAIEAAHRLRKVSKPSVEFHEGAVKKKILTAREAAIYAGLPRYLSEQPCNICGKVGERYVSNRRCVECQRVKARDSWRKHNK